MALLVIPSSSIVPIPTESHMDRTPHRQGFFLEDSHEPHCKGRAVDSDPLEVGHH